MKDILSIKLLTTSDRCLIVYGKSNFVRDYIEDLSDEQKVEYLYNVVPTRWFTDALEMNSNNPVEIAKQNAGESVKELEETLKKVIKAEDLKQDF